MTNLMNVKRAYKFPLQPTKEQAVIMAAHAEAKRRAYNWALAEIERRTRYSAFRERYFRDKAVEEGLTDFLAKKGKSDAERKQSKEFYSKHSKDASVYAKEKSKAFNDRLRELVTNVLGVGEGLDEKAAQKAVDKYTRTSALSLDAYMTVLWDTEDALAEKAEKAGRRYVRRLPHRSSVRVFDSAGEAHFAPVSRACMVHGIRDADTARTNFFKGRAKPPRFKSARKFTPSYVITESVDVDIERSRLILPPKKTMGEPVRIQNKSRFRALKTAISKGASLKTVTISYRGGKWYASVLVDENIIVPTKLTPTQERNGDVGVDVGLKHLAVLSDETRKPFENIRAYQKSAHRLAQLRRGLSRMEGSKKGETPSKRFLARKALIAKLERKVAMQRATAVNALTKTLSVEYANVSIEDLDVAALMKKPKPKPDLENEGAYLPNNRAAKRGLARSMADAALGEFRRQLTYKNEWYSTGEVTVVGKTYPSTQTCSQCGYRKTGDERLTLSERTYVCGKCGHAQDRDLNAARNIAKEGERLRLANAEEV